MSPLVIAAALSILALGAEPALAQSTAPAVTVAPVTVRPAAPLTHPEALKKSESFVQSYATPTAKLDQFARWEDPVCVDVSGVAAGQAALIKARVEEVAKELKLKLGRPKCRPNIEIRFTDQPQAVLDGVANKTPWLLGFHYPAEVEALKTVTRPVQAWYMTASRGDGTGNVALSTMNIGFLDQQAPSGAHAAVAMTGDSGLPEMIGPDDSLDTPGHRTPNGCAGRRFTSCLKSVFWHVLVVVDAPRVQGQPLGPVIDYLTMLALSQPRSLDGCLALPSVIDLFAPVACPGRPSPDGLTLADAGYLTALYSVDPEEKKAGHDLAERMAKILVNAGPK